MYFDLRISSPSTGATVVEGSFVLNGSVGVAQDVGVASALQQALYSYALPGLIEVTVEELQANRYYTHT